MELELVSLRKSLAVHRGLVEVSGLINSITDYDELLRAVLDVARRVVRAEAASLFLLDEENGALSLEISSSSMGEFAQPRITVPRGQGISGWVLEHGESLLIPDAYADERFFRDADRASGFRTRSILCAPLKRDGSLIGVLQILNPTDKQSFETEDLEGFEAYSNLIATAIEKLRAIDRIREQERVNRDVSIAAEIQQELLSRAVPEFVPGAVFASYNKAASDVGGDFFSVFPRNDGSVFFAISDVSGKGIPASLLMAQTLSAMQFVFATATGPAAALATLNSTLHDHIVRGMFITTLIGRLIPATRVIELSSAGHCRPWIVSHENKPIEIQTPGALPLGVLPDVAYEQNEITLGRGEYLVTFTDGLSESRHGDTGQFFDDHLAEELRRDFPDPRSVVDHLVSVEKRYRGNEAPRDDLTILIGGFE